MTPTDAQVIALLNQMSQGDQKAAQQLYRHFAPVIRSFLLRSGANESLVEEAVQETMLSLWKHPDRFQLNLGASFKTWLLTIAQRRLSDILKKQNKTVPLDESKRAGDSDENSAGSDGTDDGQDPGEGPPDGYARLRQQEKRNLLDECMNKLKGTHRQMLSMAYEHEMSGKEIADSMDIPEGTVKSALHYAKALMRKCLELRFQGEMR